MFLTGATQLDYVRKLCVGERACAVLASDAVFGDPCFGTVKRLAVQAVCSSVPSAFFCGLIVR